MLDFPALSQTLSKIGCVVLPIEDSFYKNFKNWREKLLAICMVGFINTFTRSKGFLIFQGIWDGGYGQSHVLWVSFYTFPSYSAIFRFFGTLEVGLRPCKQTLLHCWFWEQIWTWEDCLCFCSYFLGCLWGHFCGCFCLYFHNYCKKRKFTAPFRPKFPYFMPHKHGRISERQRIYFGKQMLYDHLLNLVR